MPKRERIRLGISIGDPAGIGYEVVLKTFLDNRMFDFCTPIVYGSSKYAKVTRKVLKIEDAHVFQAKTEEQANPKKLNIISCCADDFHLTLGEGNAETGKFAFESLQKATEAMASNKIDVLVTAPFDKNLMKKSGFEFPGHTEYLANYAHVDDYLMIMAYYNLKVGVVTGHVPLKKVSESLNADEIVKKLTVFERSLIQDFNVRKPKIALLGLNPHAGDNGLLGEEEKDIIMPAMDKAKKQGILVFGPFAADGFFSGSSFTRYDGVLAMYHDQGLIPFKSISEGRGVNYTAGLPIVRTSPDHGTAFDIAGKNQADESSFRNAVYLANDIFKIRKLNRELAKNTLKTQRLPKE